MATGTLEIVDADGTQSTAGPITGYTEEFGTNQWVVRDDATVFGGKTIEKVLNARNAYLGPNQMRHQSPQSVTITTGELLFLFKYLSIDAAASEFMYFHALSFGLPAAVQNYHARIDPVGSDLDIREDNLGTNTAVTSGTTGNGTVTWTANVWYALRLRRDHSTGVISGWFWIPSDPMSIATIESEESGALTFTSAADTTFTGTGSYGFMSRGGTSADVVRRVVPLGYATAGETAPYPTAGGATPQTVYPTAVDENLGSWTVTGAADIPTALADGSDGTSDDATYAESPQTPTTGDTLVVTATAAQDPGVDTGHVYRVRVQGNVVSGAPSMFVTPQWVRGTAGSYTVIKTGGEVALTNGTWTTITTTLDEADAANIQAGDYTGGVKCRLIPRQA